MKFCKIEKTNNVVESEVLDNDTLIRKLDFKIENHTKIHIRENQYAILLEKGKVLSTCNQPGFYEINFEELDKSEEVEKWKEYKDEKTKNFPLSIIIINLAEIVENKFYFKKPIEYIDWTQTHYDNTLKKEIPFKTSFTGDGKYNFKIQNPILFLSCVLGIRNHYTKQELIEQIRKIVVNSIQLGINELGEEYKLSVQLVKNKTNELEIRVSENDYDEKLAKRGIKITYFEITNFEEIENNKKDTGGHEFFENLFSELYKISKKPEFIEAKNINITINEQGEIIAKNVEQRCKKCGANLQKDDVYCKNCGAKNCKK